VRGEDSQVEGALREAAGKQWQTIAAVGLDRRGLLDHQPQAEGGRPALQEAGLLQRGSHQGQVAEDSADELGQQVSRQPQPHRLEPARSQPRINQP
jgi:hypothetical protein